MAKLVATYAEGFFAVFTENRTGMQQRALIDIGDKLPTPKEMADLAGVLSDQWGWANVIEKSAPKAKALPVKETRQYTSAKRTGEPVGEERNSLIIGFLADHPKSDQRAVLRGLGFEDSHARIARWHHAFAALIKANRIVAERIQVQNSRGGNARKFLYSLP
jgi:hypothetical protein